jgi:hypothetical protein
LRLVNPEARPLYSTRFEKRPGFLPDALFQGESASTWCLISNRYARCPLVRIQPNRGRSFPEWPEYAVELPESVGLTLRDRARGQVPGEAIDITPACLDRFQPKPATLQYRD